ncbi:trichothecene 3-O-acetyltransferase [Marasmius fiardii PR-910]|nr:trichothecene 3-O-acetyltransferase [Marasmius fiardii PR-910]
MLEAASANLDVSLDILGQLPGLKTYTQICFCFPLPESSSHTTIIETLKNGLERLTTSFPWVAGQVAAELSDVEGPPETLKIRAFWQTPPLVVRNLRDDPSIPSMDVLRRANFPFRMLDESIVAPRYTIPTTEEKRSEWPVFALQVNFITGGLVLTVVGQHNTMDMTGQGQLIDLLSRACRNEPFTSEELSSGNLERRTLVPLLDDSYTPGPELARQIKKLPSVPTNSDPSIPPKLTWSYISFSPTSLASLKSLATQTLHSGYISTDDALSAFIWQSVMRARLPRLNDSKSTQEATLARAVNMRKFLRIPPTYPGQMSSIAYHTSPIQKLIEEPLGIVASQLRSTLNQANDMTSHFCAMTTAFDRAPPDTVISFAASLNFAIDLMISSWTKLNCYELDFGLGLGKPESVMKPRCMSLESLGFLMPKARNGEIALGICLRDEDMERLKADGEFGKYGRWTE